MASLVSIPQPVSSHSIFSQAIVDGAIDEAIDGSSGAIHGAIDETIEGSTTRSLYITDDDQVYYDYIPTTTDPGNLLFIIALCISAASLLSLPFAVKAWRRWIAGRAKNQQIQDEEENTHVSNEPESDVPVYVSMLNFGVDSLVMHRHARVDNVAKAGDVRASSPSRLELELTRAKKNGMGAVNSGGGEIDNGNNDQHEKWTVKSCLSYIKTLASYDTESNRILKLALPFITNNIISTTSDLTILALISHKLGTDPMIAHAMVEVTVGVSSAFMMGWIETVNSLGSMAQGAENYTLVGKYLQSAVLVYVGVQIPTVLVWGFTMEKIIALFGFDEYTARIAGEYVWVYCVNEIMNGVFQAFIDFLGLIDHERLGMVFSCAADLSRVGLTLGVLYVNEGATLTMVGLVALANTCMFVFLTVLVSAGKKLTQPYEYGMVGELSLKDEAVVRALFKTGMPLAVGGLLAYAEWEVLTIFAAVLGPAEAATWAVLGFVWDVFEATTEAIGDAAEVRCAYQLGKGRPGMAKLSAHKSMLLSMIFAAIITLVFLCLHDYLPAILTHDETIQGLLVELFPLMALGNMTMTVGMVCWAIIGAQARYKLATTINLATSMLISIPLGAIMTIWLRIDLQGLTFSIVMGYVVCAWIMVVVILVSDWHALSDKIRERVANGELDIESCSTEGSGIYGAYDWDELPDEARAAAELLGYRKFLWDHDKDPEESDKYWSELSSEQKQAAKTLGYDENKWNKDDGGTKIQPIERHIATPALDPQSSSTQGIDYDDCGWDELPAKARAAAILLGYNKSLWDRDEEPEESDKYWKELSPEQREAAIDLGYDEKKWNEDDGPSNEEKIINVTQSQSLTNSKPSPPPPIPPTQDTSLSTPYVKMSDSAQPITATTQQSKVPPPKHKARRLSSLLHYPRISSQTKETFENGNMDIGSSSSNGSCCYDVHGWNELPDKAAAAAKIARLNEDDKDITTESIDIKRAKPNLSNFPADLLSRIIRPYPRQRPPSHTVSPSDPTSTSTPYTIMASPLPRGILVQQDPMTTPYQGKPQATQQKPELNAKGLSIECPTAGEQIVRCTSGKREVWTRVIDQKTGRKFYWNKGTGSMRKGTP